MCVCDKMDGMHIGANDEPCDIGRLSRLDANICQTPAIGRHGGKQSQDTATTFTLLLFATAQLLSPPQINNIAHNEKFMLCNSHSERKLSRSLSMSQASVI